MPDMRRGMALVKGASCFSTMERMRGLEWGRLYEEHHTTAYDIVHVEDDINRLRADPAIKNAKGIYEYLLDGKARTQLLDIRILDESTKRAGYEKQTQKSKVDGTSNCPLCALGNDNNKSRIYQLKEMDADHVTAWSKGGSTDLSNLTMLCQTHNRAKGNR